MSANSSIEWTESTWNPVRGCSRISPGCENCYAERMAARGLPGHNSPTTGQPFAIRKPSGPRWTGKVEIMPHMLDIPLRRKKPTTYFVNSMSDLFHESLPDEDIDRIFAVMALCPQHIFQVLTKRADRMRLYMLSRRRSSKFWKAACPTGYAFDFTSPLDSKKYSLLPFPLPNVWLGVSVEDQQRKDRIEHLRQTPAAVRFISFEPLLEDLGDLDLRGISLSIWGGESGPVARPCDVSWIRHGMRQAKRDGCLNFVKQLGARPYPGNLGPGRMPEMALKSRKGGDPSEWPEDLRVREMPDNFGGEK